jgi:hypothetical protein
MQSVGGLTTSAVVLTLTLLRYGSIKLLNSPEGVFMGSLFETLWATIIGATAASLLP